MKTAETLCVLLLLATGSAFGNPSITSIASGGSFSAMSVANGSFATIFGTGLADKEHIAGPPPWPNTLGGAGATVCNALGCVAAQVIYASPTQLNVLLPSFSGLPLVVYGYGPAGVGSAIYVSSGGLESNVFGFVLETYAPDIFFEGYDCLIDPNYQDRNPNCGLTTVATSSMQATRGAVTDQNGNLVYSGNPAKLGKYYTIWLTGVRLVLGSPNPDVGLFLGNIPAYGYANPTDAPVTPSFIGASPQFPGLVQLNFQLPINPSAYWGYTPWPCGTYRWEFDLGLQQGGNDNTDAIGDPLTFQLPVAVNPGDVPCQP